MPSRKENIYGFFDFDGNKVDEGTTKELSEKYFVSPHTITDCARGITKTILGQYRVQRIATREKPLLTERKRKIKELTEQGLNYERIAQQIDLDSSSVGKIVREMRKNGEIE